MKNRVEIFDKQNILDIAVQEYGNIDDVFFILEANGVGIDDILDLNTKLKIPSSDFPDVNIQAYVSKLTNLLATDITQDEYLELIQGPMNIPELTFSSKKYRTNTSPRNLADTLFAKWQAVDKRFLSYNPEIWLFMEKRRVRRGDYNELLVKKSWGHTPHKNGVKFPNSAFYSGTAEDLFGNQFETEFSISQDSDKYIHLPINVFNYYYYFEDMVRMPVDEDSDLSNIQLVSSNGIGKSLAHVMRFAIVIDNPDSAAKNPKIYGPMSAPVTLSATRVYGQRGYIFIFKLTDK